MSLIELQLSIIATELGFLCGCAAVQVFRR
jgi:hypothetical protein